MKDLSETCTDVENSLPLWVGGDLEPTAQREVEGHLARCTRCAEMANAVRRSRERLREGLELEQRSIGRGPDPWPAIRAALVAEGRIGGREVAIGATRAPRARLPIRAAAAAAVLFALAFAWMRSSGTGATPQTPTTAGSLPALDRGAVPVQPQVEVAPAVAGSGLRRLKPGERQLRDTAQFFYPDTYEKGNVSAVGLQGVPASPPR